MPPRNTEGLRRRAQHHPTLAVKLSIAGVGSGHVYDMEEAWRVRLPFL
jgi:hypothetical protein